MASLEGGAGFTVGQKARISLGAGKSRRCLVLCVGSDDQGARTYEVLLVSPEQATVTAVTSPDADDSKTVEREIHGVNERDLSPLQPFELDGALLENDKAAASSDGAEAEIMASAEALKEEGNVLFKLGDTQAAAEFFSKVLWVLHPPAAVGAQVLVKSFAEGEPATVRYRPGIVSDALNDEDGEGVTCDIIYDEEDADGDEEDGVLIDRVVTVSISPCVACAARLNLARCCFKASRHLEVIDVCTLVISLAKMLVADKSRPREERLKLRGHFLTALRLRGGSHLAQNHIGLARKDARSMTRSAADDAGRTQAARFEAEVEKKSKSLLKANRKLAKDVSQWVNASMARHEEGVSSSTTEGGGMALEVDSGHSPADGECCRIEEQRMGGDGGVQERKGRDSNDASGGGGVGAWLGGWLR